MASFQRIVDFRSDTLTRPSPAMREAMANAVVGDDVFGEDPTVNALEERMAKLFGKEKGLFFPSGTMSNLTAVMTWCKSRGSEMILGDLCHIHIYEQGGVSQFGGVATHLIPNDKDGTMSLEAIEKAIRVKNNPHYPITELITVENTQNFVGGRVLTPKYMEDLSSLCKAKGIPLHMDGARIWNAVTALQLPVNKVVEGVDSVTACLSKGLGAPVGSVLMGPADFIAAARRTRKALGGGMRQAGVLAAAGMQALDDFEAGIITHDHRRAKTLANALAQIPGIIVHPEDVETNIMVVAADTEKLKIDGAKLIELLKEKGILVLPRGADAVRFVLHRDINDDDVDYAITTIKDAVNGLM